MQVLHRVCRKSIISNRFIKYHSTIKCNSTFSYNDTLHFRDQLTGDEQAIYDLAKSYCRDKLLPRIVMANRIENFDRNIMTELGL